MSYYTRRVLFSSTKLIGLSSSAPKQSRRALCTLASDATLTHDQPPRRTVVDPTLIRRSANYKPSAWNFNLMQSLNNPYSGETYVTRRDKLKKIVKEMLEENQREALETLELVDELQRLGLCYHFEWHIKEVLGSIYNNFNKIVEEMGDNLHAKALAFRLLRQHGFHVSQDIFDSFKDENGEFEPSLCDDIKGMINLYEASYLSEEGEATMDMAREFTTMHLKNSLENKELDDSLSPLVDHALELPLHWRMGRLEARWFIDVCAKRANTDSLLLELAKLDYNIVQASYQEDLRYITRWWKNTGIMEKLPFTRDCIVPCLLWHIGALSEPRYGYARTTSAKVVALVSTIDDIYDIYGTIDELQRFTDAIERWDIHAIDELPYYMKVCFLLLHNYVSEMAYDALRDHGIDTIPLLKKMWVDQCKAYLQEAKWYSNGYNPTLEEYKNNAIISIATGVSIIHAYLQFENPINEKALEAICNYHDIVRHTATIIRLTDDLGTSSDELERGDTPKYVQCYMNETGASEEEAREYTKNVISETWKKLNKLKRVANPTFSETSLKWAMDFDRASHCIYEFGDGHGNVNSITQDRISSILFEPILI